MISAIRPVMGQTLPVPALCMMLPDGAARFGRRTPEPHVWPAAPSALARGDGWRGAAVMTDESIKAHLKRGDWVTLDEAFLELVPSDRKEEIKAAIADAASYGGVSAIARQVRDARIAEQARQHGSNVPPSPVRMIFTVDAAKRNAIVDRFQKAWSAIDAAVKKRLADNEWQVERIIPDGSVQSIVPLAWRNMRFRWHGEREFTEQFPGAWVCLPDDSGRGVERKRLLTMFQVRQVSAPSNVPPTVSTIQNSPAPDAETSETPQETAPPKFQISDDQLIELALDEDRRRHDAGEEGLTHDARFAFMQELRPNLSRNHYDEEMKGPLRKNAEKRGITLRGRGAPPKKNK
ncbi:hypothetical protein AA0472_2472 [Acetobacter estunensis NRIC 0472]|uniref:Uncharacterized protein n=1 Tax=Acetobacter estunensis TaxID=104097 RepID=A0A967BEE6_9PROT|nr:hypothetical protein [Acetobacter estunensis]NHO54932.1 hypothetical protein [Acetobacter estunensis]GBQ27668.1 hypothetical protein AA0472_2472 [Acetobacter estunensis NRIC 0472]